MINPECFIPGWNLKSRDFHLRDMERSGDMDDIFSFKSKFNDTAIKMVFLMGFAFFCLININGCGESSGEPSDGKKETSSKKADYQITKENWKEMVNALAVLEKTVSSLQKEINEQENGHTENPPEDLDEVNHRLKNLKKNSNAMLYRIRKLEKRQKDLKRKVARMKPRSPASANVLKPHKVYLNKPIQLFSGQVLITVLESRKESATINIQLPFQKIVWEGEVGDRKPLEYEGRRYFLELLDSENEYAILAVTKHL